MVSHHQYVFMVGGFIHFLEGLTHYRSLSLSDGHLVFQSGIAHSLRNSLSLSHFHFHQSRLSSKPAAVYKYVAQFSRREFLLELN